MLTNAGPCCVWTNSLPLRQRHGLRVAGLLFLALIFSPCVSFAQSAGGAGACPPATRKDDVVDTLHGVKVPDAYQWLEDQQSAETRAWIEAEDRCTEAALDGFSGRGALQERLNALLSVDMIGEPIERNGDYFVSRRRAGQDLFVIYKRHGLSGTDEVLLDPHGMSADHSTSVGLMSLSRDGKLAAYFIRAGGQDEVDMRFLDTETRKDLPDKMPRGDYFGVSIQPDKSGAFYSVMTEEGPRVFHHVFGSSGGDELLFGQGYGKDKIIEARLSQDGHDLLIQLIYGSGSSRSELYYKDVQHNGPVKPIVNDVEALTWGAMQGGHLIAWTNWKAPHWHVYAIDPAHASRDSWKEIIPESEAPIESVQMLGGKIFVAYVKNASSQVKIFSIDGAAEGEIPLPGIGTAGGLTGQWDRSEMFFSFESFNVPPSVERYDAKTKAVTVWAKSNVPIESEKYEVKQVWYKSKDGTSVPMFLFYKKGFPLDGTRAAWLTGYGGFDVSLTPTFGAEAVIWADAGGVFALPSLRGGSEFGEVWHKAGMMEKKQTVFDDFIAAAEWLDANSYTTPAKTAIEGGSNGGLLVGASLTQRPELYGAVVCVYPLLDMVRFHKFMEGPFWVGEYGSADDPQQFKYLLKYSPYQNVKDGTKYPPVLFVTGDGDTRVAPLHARKMTARLQAATSGGPVLLLYDTKSGHSGGRPLSKLIEEKAKILSFVFSELHLDLN
jgi:prolyl oligopeptidase